MTGAFATAEGTAVAGTNYQTKSGRLVFRKRQRRKKIAVKLLAAPVGTRGATFAVHLSSPTDAVLLDPDGTATIRERAAVAAERNELPREFRLGRARVGPASVHERTRAR